MHLITVGDGLRPLVRFWERGGSTSIITLPQKRESEASVYFPFGGNLDTGGTRRQREGTTDDRRNCALARPKGLVPGNGTVLPLERGRSEADRFQI